MKRLVNESRKQLKYVDESISYCNACGSTDVSSFYEGEFVLVAVPGTRPYYGRLLEVKTREGQKPQAVILKGGTEREEVYMSYIRKAGD